MASLQEGQSPVHPGDILAGKYRVERVLGVGGMGVVVAAEHVQLSQKVALKFVLPGALQSEAAVERFLREARAAVRLKSEHVAKVQDVGTLENGAPYMVMEYLEGSDLSKVLQEQGALDAQAACDFVIQACEAVAEAHSLGIVHRDLKPQNLFLTKAVGGAPLVKVLDFGVSKIDAGPDSKKLTQTTTVMGSPLYMAPEQMRSARNADARSDIWALGVVLYELLSGKVPFDAESMPELCLKVVTDPVPSLLALRPDLPPALEAVVRTCLEKKPEDRYADPAELAAALEPFASEASRVTIERTRLVTTRMSTTGGTPRPRMPSVGAISQPELRQTPPPWADTNGTPKAAEKSKLPVVAIAIVGVVAVAGVAALALTRSAPPAPPSAASSATPPPPAATTATPPATLTPPTLASAPASAAPPDASPAVSAPAPAPRGAAPPRAFGGNPQAAPPQAAPKRRDDDIPSIR